MSVRVAKTAGFCFGVNNAVKTAFKTAENAAGGKVYTFGPLIHNESVIGRLAEHGVTVLEDISGLRPEDSIIIRAHGVPKATYDKLNATGAHVVDATCPFVKKIHRRVENELAEGRKIIIIGDKSHPEVIGINGWCNDSAIIISSVEEAKTVDWQPGKYSSVVQTTFNEEKYQEICYFLKKTLDEIIFYDSICSATSCRQAEARKLASESELMIIVGSALSSNTQRLREICGEVCGNVILVQSPDDLKDVEISKFLDVGVTAGASTPDWLIKEVLFMEEVNSIVTTDETEDFGAMLEASELKVTTGDVKEVEVLKIEDTRVIVNLNFKFEGFIDINEFKKNEDGTLDVAVGDKITATVVHVNHKDEEVKLSKLNQDKSKELEELKEAFENKTTLTLTISKAVEHGVIAYYGNTQIYISQNHLALNFVKPEKLASFVGKEINARITTFEKVEGKNRMKISASAKVLLAEEKKARDEEFWGNIENGKVYAGIIKTVKPYGAFVELAPGYEGLLHVTEMSYKKIKNAGELYTVGQEVEVTVKDFSREKETVSLTVLKPEDDPWFDAETKYAKGTILEVTVSKFTDFGAFVEVTPEIMGLVHISQISNYRIDNASECLTIGQTVSAKVVDIDTEKKRLKLSIKAVQAYDPAEQYDENGNVIEREKKQPFKKRDKKDNDNADAPKAQKPKRAPRKEPEEKPQDYITQTEKNTMADVMADLDFNFDEQ